MSDLSEMYIFLRAEVQGKKKLDSNEVNPLLREYRRKLEAFKVEEIRSDGKTTKIRTDYTDEFTYELLNDGKTLLFSYKLKLNIYDPHPHSFNNYAHSIQVKISQGLSDIQVEGGGKGFYGKIIIVTTGIKFPGSAGTGRWPREEIPIIGF